MTQNTKNLLMIGGVAVVGYLIYKQMSKPKNFANYVDSDFFNASGRLTGRRRTDPLPDCPNCGKEGLCLSQEVAPNREPYISAGIAGQRIAVNCSGGTTASASRRGM